MADFKMDADTMIAKHAIYNSAGDVAIIGALSENNCTGAAYIYTLKDGEWTQTARLASGVANSYFGYSVSINSAGTVAIVGAWNENNCTGAAYVFNLVDGEWTQTVRLASGIANSHFGTSVNIDSTRDVAIIGAHEDNNHAGAVYIYTLSDGVWLQTAKLASGVANGDFGWSVNINSTRNIAVIGAISDGEDGTGAAYIYTLIDGVWTQSVRLATGITGSNFGESVSINGIGDTVSIGAYIENTNVGIVYDYTLLEGVWAQTA